MNIPEIRQGKIGKRLEMFYLTLILFKKVFIGNLKARFLPQIRVSIRKLVFETDFINELYLKGKKGIDLS